MWPFKQKEERAEQMAEPADTREGQLLSAALTGSSYISREQAMQIPAVAACVRMISDTVSMIPFKLYKANEETRKLEEQPDDPRVRMLNVDTNDTLDGVQFKKSLVEDYLLDKGGYAYIEKNGNIVKALRYVEPMFIGIEKNAEPIFKTYDINVNGERYKPYEFIKILRSTKDGSSGTSVIEESSAPLMVAWRITQFQDKLLKTGGSKKGFIKSPKHLTAEAIKALKEAWRRMFSDNNNENVVVLNEGMEFQESSETSTEMQINESVNTLSKQICEIFGIPGAMLGRDNGLATKEDRVNYLQYCIQPILHAIETALNRDLLLESEKGSYKFIADTSEFTKADVLERYQAYEIASKNGFMQIDEIRFKENLEPLGLDFVKLGLQDVLYYPEKDGLTFMPNMNQIGGIELAMEDRERLKQEKDLQMETAKMQLNANGQLQKEKEGGNTDANRNKE